MSSVITSFIVPPRVISRATNNKTRALSRRNAITMASDTCTPGPSPRIRILGVVKAPVLTTGRHHGAFGLKRASITGPRDAILAAPIQAPKSPRTLPCDRVRMFVVQAHDPANIPRPPSGATPHAWLTGAHATLLGGRITPRALTRRGRRKEGDRTPIWRRAPLDRRRTSSAIAYFGILK